MRDSDGEGNGEGNGEGDATRKVTFPVVLILATKK